MLGQRGGEGEIGRGREGEREREREGGRRVRVEVNKLPSFLFLECDTTEAASLMNAKIPRGNTGIANIVQKVVTPKNTDKYPNTT